MYLLLLNIFILVFKQSFFSVEDKSWILLIHNILRRLKVDRSFYLQTSKPALYLKYTGSLVFPSCLGTSLCVGDSPPVACLHFYNEILRLCFLATHRVAFVLKSGAAYFQKCHFFFFAFCCWHKLSP